MELYSIEVTTLTGKRSTLAEFAGQVLLIVNTASRCGFTPQFTQLQELHEKYGSRGFVVLGFPCNQFGRQEPGSNQEIGDFCEINYRITFPMFEKLDVNGPNAHPLFRHLKQQAPGLLGFGLIKWNFTKFLVARDGRVVSRFPPNEPPQAIAPAIEALLAAPVPTLARE